MNIFINKNNNKNLLTIYYTAGFPNLHDTLPILQHLEKAGVDVVEIGMPYSDPIADGETIQQSNQRALENGMSLKLLFEQLKDFRRTVKIPVFLMGYINPVLQFGIENFLATCAEIGINGVILPDLPSAEYESEYKPLFEKYALANVFLITPQTSEARIRKIDKLSSGFIYMVSTSSTTGNTQGITQEQIQYFERIKAMNLQNITQIGFGISDKQSFQTACQYANGAIIGSAFIKMLAKSTELEKDISTFVRQIKA